LLITIVIRANKTPQPEAAGFNYLQSR